MHTLYMSVVHIHAHTHPKEENHKLADISCNNANNVYSL